MSLRDKLLAAKSATSAQVTPSSPFLEGKGEKAPIFQKKIKIWTPEQEAFFNHPSDSRIFLSALAGTGKTTSLLEYAKRHPHEKWHFMAFNASVADDVRKKAPQNIYVKTVHATAFAKFGKHLQHKIKESFLESDFKKFLPEMNKKAVTAIMKSFELWLHQYMTIEEFCFKNFPPDVGLSSSDGESIFRSIWKECLDPSSDFTITHDVYLKRLTQSDFKWPGRIMLDEAQDWNGALLGHLESSSYEGVVCGDPFQNLYAFRHAVVHLSPKKMEAAYWLTQSFRQPDKLTKVVNRVLHKMGSVKTLKPSLSLDDDGHVTSEEESGASISSFQPSIILAYDNKTLNQMDLAPDISRMTIHASKGLEFDNVWIADHDIPSFVTQREKLSLMYVAFSRPKKSLRIPALWLEDMGFSDVADFLSPSRDISETMEMQHVDGSEGFFDVSFFMR